MTKFESTVKVIPYSQERVYEKLSDLSNLEALKDRLPEDKVKDISFDSDTLSVSVSLKNTGSVLSLRPLTLHYLSIFGFSLLRQLMKSVS